MGRLTGCCGCFDLRDGAKAVGVTHLVLACVQFIIYVCGLVMLLELASRGPVQLMQFMHILTIYNPTLVFQMVCLFGTNLLHIVMNALLVHGINKKRSSMLLAWLCYSVIWLILATIAVIVFFAWLCILFSNHVFSWVSLTILVVAAGLVGVFWYWFVVVLACYHEMREANGSV